MKRSQIVHIPWFLVPFTKGGIVVEEYRKSSVKVPVIVLVVFNIESGETSMNTTQMDVNIQASMFCHLQIDIKILL